MSPVGSYTGTQISALTGSGDNRNACHLSPGLLCQRPTTISGASTAY